VADAPDPLGKRALFWAPAERHEAGPRRPEKRVLPGRHALFSAAGTGAPADAPRRNGRPRPQVTEKPQPLRSPRPPRVSAARTKPAPKAATPKVAGKAATTPGPPQPDRRDGGPISLSCSKCGTHTGVDILKYVVLHLPWWLWRPGRGYTNLMKCPACGQRAWVSASLAPGKR
jgi:hypothetical protein